MIFVNDTLQIPETKHHNNIHEWKEMVEVTAGFEEWSDKEKVALVLDEGCRDLKAGKPLSVCGERDSLLQSSHRRAYWYPPVPSPDGMTFFY